MAQESWNARPWFCNLFNLVVICIVFICVNRNPRVNDAKINFSNNIDFIDSFSLEYFNTNFNFNYFFLSQFQYVFVIYRPIYRTFRLRRIY